MILTTKFSTVPTTSIKITNIYSPEAIGRMSPRAEPELKIHHFKYKMHHFQHNIHLFECKIHLRSAQRPSSRCEGSGAIRSARWNHACLRTKFIIVMQNSFWKQNSSFIVIELAVYRPIDPSELILSHCHKYRSSFQGKNHDFQGKNHHFWLQNHHFWLQNHHLYIKTHPPAGCPTSQTAPAFVIKWESIFQHNILQQKIKILQ